MSPKTTFAPALAYSIAVAAPIPVDPPVITATLSLSRIFIFGLLEDGNDSLYIIRPKSIKASGTIVKIIGEMCG